MPKRKKKTIINEEISRERAAELMARYAEVDNQLENLKNKMEKDILKIRELYQKETVKLSEQRDLLFEKLEHFAKTHPEYFAKKRSLRFPHGMIGFRKGQPKLKTLRGFTWKKVTELLREYLPGYVITEYKPNKESLLRDRDLLGDDLEGVGLMVDQSETFFVEPNREEI